MSPSAGALIWISCRPLIRLYVRFLLQIWVNERRQCQFYRAAGVASGVFITKADIFPPVAARGAGQIALNITLPCLLFSKIVPAFTTDNIKALGELQFCAGNSICSIESSSTGPLVLVAVLYEALGIVLAWLIRQFYWVPHRFRFGFLIAGGWGNVGDLGAFVLFIRLSKLNLIKPFSNCRYP